MSLNKELLDILACPKCKGDLELTAEQDGLVCHVDELVYAIRDEIPIMIVEQAIPLAEWNAGRRNSSS